MTGAPTLTVYYNGACPICRAEISHYAKLAKRNAVDDLEFQDLTDDPDILHQHGLTRETARRRLYAQAGSGALISGIESFIAIWSRLPGYRWLARLARLPVLHQGAKLSYDHIAVPVLAWMNDRREAKAAARQIRP